MELRRENRILRVAVVVLFAAVVAGWSPAGGQAQRLPGPGSGVVEVSLANDGRVNAAQLGEWRVAQQGEWRASVQGTVATLPSMPPILRVGGRYEIRWPGRDPDVLTIGELHPSGWARVTTWDNRVHWINLTTAVSLAPR
jgi:hypothetical protein